MGEVIKMQDWLRKKALNIDTPEIKEPKSEEGDCPLCSAPAVFYPSYDDAEDVIFNSEKILEGMKRMQESQKAALTELLKDGQELDSMLERVDMAELLLDIGRYREVLLNLIEEFGAQDNTPVRNEIFDEAEALLDEYDAKFGTEAVD